MQTTTELTRSVITEFARLMYQEKNPARAMEQFVSADYIQHNPMLTDGRDVASAFLSKLYSDPKAEFEVQRILVDEQFAALHVRAHPVGRHFWPLPTSIDWRTDSSSSTGM